MSGIKIGRTHYSLLPWRLFVDGKMIPHSSCRTRSDVDNLKTRLEQVGDWTQLSIWSEETYAAARAILATNDIRKQHGRALAELRKGK